MARSGDVFPIVALVGSAGGLEAVSRVLEPLPRAFPGSLVVLIHCRRPGRAAWSS